MNNISRPVEPVDVPSELIKGSRKSIEGIRIQAENRRALVRSAKLIRTSEQSFVRENSHLNRAETQVPDGTLTQGAVMEMLRIGRPEMKRLLKERIIKPAGRCPKRGWYYYDLESIKKLKESTAIVVPDEEQAALPHYTKSEGVEIFRALNAGKDMGQIVTDLDVHPMVVRAVIRDYQRLTGALVLSGDVMARINELPMDGEFPIFREGQILALLDEASRHKKCPRCKKRDKSELCGTCFLRVRAEAVSTKQELEDLDALVVEASKKEDLPET